MKKEINGYKVYTCFRGKGEDILEPTKDENYIYIPILDNYDLFSTSNNVYYFAIPLDLFQKEK